MHQKRFFQHGGKCRNNDREMHRKTTSHYRIHGKLFRRDRSLPHRLDTNQMFSGHQRPVQTCLNRIRCRWHDGQPIRPLSAVVKFLRSEDVLNLVAFRNERHRPKLRNHATGMIPPMSKQKKFHFTKLAGKYAFPAGKLFTDRQIIALN